MPPVQYLAVGFLIALALVAGTYSWAVSVACLVGAYGLFRLRRENGGEGSLFPEIGDPLGRTGPMEVLQESPEELVVRGSERVLILNRKTGTISGIHAALATFAKVSEIQIQRVTEDDSSRTAGYSVSLVLGPFPSICLGCTDSQIDASTMAAKLGSWTGKNVVA